MTSPRSWSQCCGSSSMRWEGCWEAPPWLPSRPLRGPRACADGQEHAAPCAVSAAPRKHLRSRIRRNRAPRDPPRGMGLDGRSIVPGPNRVPVLPPCDASGTQQSCRRAFSGAAVPRVGGGPCGAGVSMRRPLEPRQRPENCPFPRTAHGPFATRPPGRGRRAEVPEPGVFFVKPEMWPFPGSANPRPPAPAEEAAPCAP